MRKAATGSVLFNVDAETATTRTQCVVDMLRVNKVLQTIESTPAEWDSQLLKHEIKPRLEINRYRPRIRAVAKDESSCRPQLLGRAFHAVGDDTTLLFMFLRDNTDIDWAEQRLTSQSRKRGLYSK